MRPDIKAAIDRYAEEGWPVGNFLTAVFENNLMESFNRADDDNRRDLFEICSYVYMEIPSDSWGSRERVKDWLDKFHKEREAAAQKKDA